MSSSAELQGLFYATLKGDAAIMAIAHKVYDRVPSSPFGEKTAYITLGATDGTDDTADCIDGQEINTTIHCWSRAVGKIECKRLTDLVRKKLHRASLSLTANALAFLEVESTRVFDDPDGITTHGVVQVRAAVEEP